MKSEDERLKDAFLDMINQACGEWEPAVYDHELKKYVQQAVFKGYDSMCLSAYENALDLAVEFGWIEQKHVLR